MSHFELQPATPSVKEIFDSVEEEFNLLLAQKTNWGRNEVKEMFLKAKANAAIRLLNNKENS